MKSVSYTQYGSLQFETYYSCTLFYKNTQFQCQIGAWSLCNKTFFEKKTDSNENTVCPVVLNPYIRYSGMYRPKEYGF